MSDHNLRRNVPINVTLHPLVYGAIIGLTLWLVLSIWLLFDSGAYVGLILTMIAAFFVIMVGIPTLIWLSWRHNTEPEARGRAENYRSWTMHQFSTCTENLRGSAAAVQILLPLAAVSFGMTVFGLVYYFAVPQLGS